MSKTGQGPRKQTQVCVQFSRGELSGRRGQDLAEADIELWCSPDMVSAWKA